MWKIVTKKNQELLETFHDINAFVGDNRYLEKSQRALQSIHERNAHILCGCRNSLMFVRHRDSYQLVNHAILGEHSETCPFFTQVSGKIASHEAGGFAEAEEITSFSFHEKIAEQTADSPDRRANRESSSTSSSPRLARLLNQLLTKSFLNSYYSGKSFSGAPQVLSVLRKPAAAIAFGTASLDKFVFFGHKGWDYARSRLNSTWDNYPGRPHCIYLETKQSVEEMMPGVLMMDGTLVSVQRVIHHYNRSPGPFLIISTLTNDFEDDIARHTSVIVPVYSQDLPIPVDSDNERKIANHLRKLVDSSELKLTFYKPLNAKRGEDGSALLPDFILNDKTGGNRVIIEVMGFDTDEYLDRKERLIPQMVTSFNARCAVEVDGSESYEEFADKLLSAASIA